MAERQSFKLQPETFCTNGEQVSVVVDVVEPDQQRDDQLLPADHQVDRAHPQKGHEQVPRPLNLFLMSSQMLQQNKLGRLSSAKSLVLHLRPEKVLPVNIYRRQTLQQRKLECLSSANLVLYLRSEEVRIFSTASLFNINVDCECLQ